MKTLLTITFLLVIGSTYAQIRPFDNSKMIMPWLYNPSAAFTKDFQTYFGYDGRGQGSVTPQSFVAGLRLPVAPGKKRRRRPNRPETLMGAQVLNTSQDLVKELNVNVSYAQQIQINRRVKFAMGLGFGINNIDYDYDELFYIDQQDPLLNSGDKSFGLHLNAGFSLIVDEHLFVYLAAPYLLRDNSFNISEIILRAGYSFPINQDVNLIASVNLDNYNLNLIYGGDLQLEIRKMVSIIAGADRNKYHGGLFLNFKPFGLGYTYGQNFTNNMASIVSHQISVTGNFELR